MNGLRVDEYPEGATPLDRDEMEGLRFPHVETWGELDQLEQQNIQDGYLWLVRQRKYRDFMDVGFVTELHRKLFGKVWRWAGQYRTSGKNIGVDYPYIGIRLSELLDNVRYWVEHETFSNQELAARFHHQLVLIHPFPNGNGRHARIMTDILLEKVVGAEPVQWGEGLEREGEHRQRYLRALRAADQGDYQLLIEFVS